MKKEFSVFPQNLAYYNEGELVGRWIELPQSPENIKKYLKEDVKIDSEHEEYEIADVDEYPFSYESAQWASLEKLNSLAIIYSQLNDEQKEAVLGYADATSNDYSIDELINLCLQVDKICYYRYDFVGMENGYYTPETKLGYTLAEANGLYEELERLNVENCFDFEKYGEEMGYDFELLDNGYIDMSENSIELDLYTKDEIDEEVKEILENQEITVERE